MRKQKTYTIVQVNAEGDMLRSSDYTRESLPLALAKIDAADLGKTLVFEGQPVEFTVSTDPVVTIGAPRTRKTRKPKAEPKQRVAKVKPISKTAQELDAGVE